ncbi:MAG: YbaB/EbfC family nucleoid-associated protein [Victivallales bacterium]|nr:YbaB/EbfC family nucleoid-associated protein [Victivallales bacterium]
MFGKIGDMSGMMKKALEMKNEMGKVKEEIAETEVKGVCENAVEVTLLGNMEVKKVRISPEAVNTGDVRKLEDMVTVAMGNAVQEAKELSKKKMAAVTGGMNIPGLSGLFEQ